MGIAVMRAHAVRRESSQSQSRQVEDLLASGGSDAGGDVEEAVAQTFDLGVAHRIIFAEAEEPGQGLQLAAQMTSNQAALWSQPREGSPGRGSPG
jgi:hypothetical protein